MEPNIIRKTCKIHGETDFVLRDQYRCKKCASAAVIKRRKKLKLMAVEYKGDACIKCGYNKCLRSLDFHHLDPTMKDFHLGENGATRAWDKIKAELDKCVLVCANCHGEIHDGLLNINDYIEE